MDTKRKFQKNEELILNIDDLGKDGEGIGHVEGYTLFVKGALPGETVRVSIMKAKKNMGFARLLEIITSSPHRCEPACPTANQCGGCTLQHLSYEGQLAMKEKKVRDCLTRIGGVDLEQVEWLPIIGMTEGHLNYRNKAQFPVRPDENGEPVTGFFAGRSHRLIPTKECRIQHPVINQAANIVMDFLREYHIPPYDEESHDGLVRHIYVRRGYHTGQVMVCLVVNGNSLPHAEELANRLQSMEGFTSLLLNVNQERTNVILGREMKLLWGKAYIEDTIGQLRYRISAPSFYQVNPVQTVRLYETALSFAGLNGGETVWDLYCGIGTISLFLARQLSEKHNSTGRVIGVEIVPEAVENAKENARLNGLDNAEFYCGAAEDVVAALVSEENHQADVVVVDPPRKGCDAKLLDTMVKMQPDRIVYVSCDPATLARDVKVLGEQGYEVRKVQACDMFPGGGNVESIVKLVRKSNRKSKPDTYVKLRLDMEDYYRIKDVEGETKIE